MDPRAITDMRRLLAIVQDEFREMPGLRLTRQQVQRLWTLDPGTCDAVLDALVVQHFLTRTEDGAFCRTGGGLASR